MGPLWLPHVNMCHFITLVFGEDYKLRTLSVFIFLVLFVTATFVQTFSISCMKIH